MYTNEGIDQIEDTQVLKLDPFIKMGKPAAIVKLFGGKDGYMQAVRELEEEIYKEIS
jgi:type I restriction enzyme R subunit